MRTTFTIRAAWVLALAAASAACSKQPAQETPLVIAPAQVTPQPLPPPASSSMTGSIDAAGIPAEYEARFEGNQLQRIVETRASGTAQYEFKGARLLHYSGTALHTRETVDLRMDVNGKVLSATSGAQPMQQEQISEISSRAQLLRSHALAQSASRSHQ